MRSGLRLASPRPRCLSAFLSAAILGTVAYAADPASDYRVFARPADRGTIPGWVGDVIPYQTEDGLSIFYLYEKRPNGDAFHPWYRFETQDLAGFVDCGQAIPTGFVGDQDLALGTGSVIQPNGPTAFWPFSDLIVPTTGGEVVSSDSIGSIALAWDGTTPAPSVAAGIVGDALQIDGGTRITAQPGPFQLSYSFSISFFLNPIDVNASIGPKAALITMEGVSAPAWGIELLDADQAGQTRLNFFVFDSNGADDVVSPAGSIPSESANSSDEWIHVVASYDSVSGTLRLVLNGAESVNQATGLQGGPRFDGRPLTIGSRQGAFALGSLPAAFDSVQLFDRALTASDISRIASSPGAPIDPEHFAFYTGFNWQFQNQGLPAEGVMLATSADLETWTKRSDFSTLLAPPSSQFDEDNFRDPFVFRDDTTGEFRMLLSSRDRFASWAGALAEYRSADLMNWNLMPDAFLEFPGEPIPEVATLFQDADLWYLVYSRPEGDASRGTYYRSAPTLDGPWSARTRLDSRAFYAGSTVAFDGSHALVGCISTKESDTNNGAWQWAGNLVAHRIVVEPSGALSLKPAPMVDQRFGDPLPVLETGLTGSVTALPDGYSLAGASSDVAFDRLRGARKLTGTVTIQPGADEAGLFLGGRANEVIFDPALNRIRFGSDVSVTFVLDQGIEYSWTCFIEGSIAVLYVEDPSGRSVAVSMRNYDLQGGEWGIFARGGAVFEHITIDALLGADESLISLWRLDTPDPLGTPFSNSVFGGPVLIADPALPAPGTTSPDGVDVQAGPFPGSRLAADDPALSSGSFSFAVLVDPVDIGDFRSILSKESAAPNTFAGFQRVGWQVLHTTNGTLEFVIRGDDPGTQDFFGSIFVTGAPSGFPAGSDPNTDTMFQLSGGYDADTGEAAFFVTRFDSGVPAGTFGEFAQLTSGASQDTSPISIGAVKSLGDIVFGAAGVTATHAQVYDRLLTPSEFASLTDQPAAPIPGASAGPVDTASPFGVLDFFDLIRFLRHADQRRPIADIAPPFGVINSADRLEAVRSIEAGAGG